MHYRIIHQSGVRSFFFFKPKFQMICFVQYLVYHRWNIVVVKVRGDYAANVLRTTRVA